MNRPRIRLSIVLVGALVIGLVAGACDTVTPTVSNPTSGPSDTATTAPASTGPAESASSEPSASGSASSEATPESTPEATPEASGATPGATSSSAATECAGGSDPTFFVSAANGLPFDVYCPVLAANWYVAAGGGEWRGGTDQWLQISYKGPGGAQFTLQEGAFCTGGLSLCSSHDSVIGPASFGDLAGSLDALGPTDSYGYAVYIGAGTRQGYTISGMGMSQDAFTAIAAGFIKVPKS